MCKSTIKPATREQLNQLRDPGALHAIELLKKAGWLAVDTKSLNKVFAAEPSHPVRQALYDEARTGGKFAALQIAVLLGFTALAIVLSSLQPVLSPTVFTLWGALGVCAGLLVSNYPGRLFKKQTKT